MHAQTKRTERQNATNVLLTVRIDLLTSNPFLTHPFLKDGVEMSDGLLPSDAVVLTLIEALAVEHGVQLSGRQAIGVGGSLPADHWRNTILRNRARGSCRGGRGRRRRNTLHLETHRQEGRGRKEKKEKKSRQEEGKK